MKKNKKIITTALGSAALAGGITVAAVAQACGGDSGRNEAQDITNIVNSINELSDYNPGSGDPSNILSSLANGILGSFETALVPNSAPQNATFAITELETIRATDSLVTANTNNNGYTLQNLVMIGSGVLSSNSNELYTISGTLTLAINVTNNILTAGEASGIEAVDEETAIIAAVNVLSSYTWGTTITNSIASQILSQTTGNLPVGSLLISLSFTNITSSSIVIQNNTYSITVVNVATLAVLSNGEVATSFGTWNIDITPSDGQFNVVASLTDPTSAVQEIITGINELSSYTGTSTPLTSLGIEFLAALDNTLNGTPLQTSLFQSIDMSNILINDSNTAIEVSIPNFVGTTNSPTSPNVSGTAVVSITINGTNGDLEIGPGAVTGLTQTEIEIADIVNAANSLNSYTADDTSNQTPLSLLMVMQIGTITSVPSENFTFGNIFASVFNSVTSTDVQTVNATTWIVSISVNTSLTPVGITMNGREVVISDTTLLLQVESVGNEYMVSAAAQNNTEFTVAETNLSLLIDDLNSAPIRAYDGSTASPTERVNQTITSITNAFDVSASPVAIDIQNWSYDQITIFNVSNSGTTYTVVFPNIIGTANQVSNPTDPPYELTGTLGPNNNAVIISFIVLAGGTTVNQTMGANATPS